MTLTQLTRSWIVLAEVGIEIAQITDRLQDDGVDAFADSFKDLIDQVDSKRNILRTGVMNRQKLALGMYVDAVQAAVKALKDQYFNSRLWNHDGSLWKEDGPTLAKIENRLGWLHVLDTIDLERLKALQAGIKDGDFDHVVLLGMGGSSLAPEVLATTFNGSRMASRTQRAGQHPSRSDPAGGEVPSTWSGRCLSSPANPAGRLKHCRCTDISASASGTTARSSSPSPTKAAS
jgi:hypothetical protein